MAVISNMQFTYPILCDYKDDYINVRCTAGTTGVMEKTKKYSTIKTYVEITDEKINQFLKDGTAKIITKVYCNTTKYRNIFEIRSGNDQIIIQNKDINKKVELSTFVVLTKNIENYTNSNFNKDYKGKYFNLEKGTILAIGKQENIFVEKDINELTKLSSVIVVCKGKENNGPMTVDYSDEKIRITLSEESEYIYKKWYRVIAKKASEVIGKEFTIEYIKNCGSFELLQKIFEIPISDALEMIKNKWDNEGGLNED